MLVAPILITALIGLPVVGVVLWYAQACVTAVAVIAGIVIRERFRCPDQPMVAGYRRAWRVSRSGTLTSDRLYSYAFTIALLPLYFGAFGGWKTAITHGPFRWDEQLMGIDRLLFATDPWRLLHPVLSSPRVTHGLVTLYAYGWTIAVNVAIAYSALTRRLRFLLANMIAWPVCGVLLAWAFLSAGPAFYGVVVGEPNPYRELVDYHHSIQSSANYWQRYLWSVYGSGEFAVGSGISAMPSMHLVIGTVCACVVWDRGARWRTAAALFVAVLHVGSIYSGWHYAVDGIVGIPLGIGCWWLAGWLTRDGWSSAARTAARARARVRTSIAPRPRVPVTSPR